MLTGFVITVGERQSNFDRIQQMMRKFGYEMYKLDAVDARKPEVLESILDQVPVGV
jgi:hypothetical protein